MRFIGVLVVGHDARLKVFTPSIASETSLGIPPKTAWERPPIYKVVSTGFLGVSLSPGHHEQTQAAAERKPQDER